MRIREARAMHYVTLLVDHQLSLIFLWNNKLYNELPEYRCFKYIYLYKEELKSFYYKCLHFYYFESKCKNHDILLLNIYAKNIEWK